MPKENSKILKDRMRFAIDKVRERLSPRLIRRLIPVYLLFLTTSCQKANIDTTQANAIHMPVPTAKSTNLPIVSNITPHTPLLLSPTSVPTPKPNISSESNRLLESEKEKFNLIEHKSLSQNNIELYLDKKLTEEENQIIIDILGNPFFRSQDIKHKRIIILTNDQNSLHKLFKNNDKDITNYTISSSVSDGSVTFHRVVLGAGVENYLAEIEFVHTLPTTFRYAGQNYIGAKIEHKIDKNRDKLEEYFAELTYYQYLKNVKKLSDADISVQYSKLKYRHVNMTVRELQDYIKAFKDKEGKTISLEDLMNLYKSSKIHTSSITIPNFK